MNLIRYFSCQRLVVFSKTEGQHLCFRLSKPGMKGLYLGIQDGPIHALGLPIIPTEVVGNYEVLDAGAILADAAKDVHS